MTGGVWLVLIGATLSVAMTFFFWGAVSSNDGGGGMTSWQWVFTRGAYSWTGLRPSLFFDGLGDWWTWREWVVHVLWGASIITTILCAVAGILALVRGAGGERVSGSLILAFGIADAVVLVAYIAYWGINPDYRYLGVTDLVALTAAILIIVGGAQIASASRRGADPYASASLPFATGQWGQPR